MPVEFRVLGPLEIRRDGTPVRLRASKQRTFLAVLLVNRGRVVSVDRLIEDVWPDAPPAGARHALETHASRLRGLLGDDLPLVARPPGYVLDVDPQSIDSVRFEQLLEEARSTEPARAAARAADALALWRGEPLAEFAFDSFAQEEIARLQELRQEAEEERIEAELALGRATELIGELEALVAAAPLRERRRGQLMLALYRAGRQADALAELHRARTLLLDELGLEPGQALRELERAILQQDPGLLTSTSRAESPTERRPVSVVAVEPAISLELDPEAHDRATRRAHEIVADIGTLFDAKQPEPFVLVFAQEDHAHRASAAAGALLAAVDARVGVESGEALLGDGLIRGPLVERARRRARDGVAPEPPPAELARKTDGPFVGRQAELALLGRLPAALVLGPPGIGKSRLAQELAHGRRTAVGRCSSFGIDARAPLDEVAAALGEPRALRDVLAPEVPLTFRRICERAAPVLVVLDDAQWADPIVLDSIEQLVLRGSEEVRLVCIAREDLVEDHPAFMAGVARVALEPLSPAEAEELAAELGATDGVAVDRAEGNPLFIEQLLAHEAEALDALPTNLQSLLIARLDRLAPAERRVVERAAVIGREFDGTLVEELLDGRSAREPLASLVRRRLIEPVPPSEAFEERFRFRHLLIHEAAYGSTPNAERCRLHEMLADVLAARGEGDEVIGFHLDRAATLRPERDRHALRLAEDAGKRLGAAGIAVWKRGDARAAMRLLTRATELLPAENAKRAELLCELGVALHSVGDVERAQAELEKAAVTGDRRTELRARIEQSAIDALADAGEGVARLLELIDTGLPVFEAVGDERSLGRAWMLAGWIRGGAFARHAAWEEAAEHALTHYRRAGWPTSTCAGHLAAALYLGPTPVQAAVDRCTQLLDSEVHDLVGGASVSAHLGGLHAMAGRFAEADSLLELARTTYTELGRVPSLARTCAPVEARVALLRGDPEAAAVVLRQSCDELLASRGGFHLTTQAAELADTLLELDRAAEAEDWCAVAERHARVHDLAGQVSVRLPRSRLLARRDSGASVALAREAVELAERTDESNLRASARLALADALAWAGHDDEAASQLAEAARLYDEKGDAAAAHRLTRRRTAATPF